MSNLLLIGDSYPLFSYRSACNLEIAESLHRAGHDVYLLSKSWCRVSEDNFFGDVAVLSKPAPFKKRFFVDPIQLRATGPELLSAMLGLGVQILEQEQIDAIVFADELSFLPLVELFRARFQIPCFLFLFQERQSLVSLFDDYLFPIFQHGFQSFERIFTFPAYHTLLTKTFHVSEDAVTVSVPFSCPGNVLPPYDETALYVVAEPFRAELARETLTTAENDLCGPIKHFFLCAPNWPEDSARLGSGSVRCVRTDQLPAGSLVLLSSELNSRSPTSLDWLLYALRRKWLPVIRLKNLPALLACGAEGFQIEDYYVIQKLRLPYPDVITAILEFLPKP